MTDMTTRLALRNIREKSLTASAMVSQVVLAGLKKGLSLAEADQLVRKAAAEGAEGYGRISEAEKDFTSQVSCPAA